MKAGGRGNLMTTLPRISGSVHYLLASSKILTSYPGIDLVTEPGKVGKTVPKSLRFKTLAEIGHPVSVYHQVSLIKTFGKCF
jgi:hypothetical protein